MGDLKDFYLSAHSFGAYLAGSWALKHPENFKKLLLLSPVGIKKRPKPGEDTEELDFAKRFKGRQKTLPPKVLEVLLGFAHKQKFSPLSVGRLAGRNISL